MRDDDKTVFVSFTGKGGAARSVSVSVNRKEESAAEENPFSNMTVDSMYHKSSIIAKELMERFDYSYGDWREILESFPSLTNPEGEKFKSIAGLEPSAVLEPEVIENRDGKRFFFPCDDCCQCRGFIYEHLGAERGFCVNCQSCEYVGKRRGSGDERYNRYYELYMRTDTDFLRLIDDMFRLRRGLESFFLRDTRWPIIADISSIAEKYGINIPHGFTSVFTGREDGFAQFKKREKAPVRSYFPKGENRVKRNLNELNDRGLMAYEVKCIAALIHHFGYDIEDWREVLEFICDYTELSDSAPKDNERKSKSSLHWGTLCGEYDPQHILYPKTKYNDGSRFPRSVCFDCRNENLQFQEYGADSGLCLNIQKCRKDELSRGIGQEDTDSRLFNLYINADFRLLRAISSALSHTSELGYCFNDGRITFLWDTLKIFDELNIPYPDFEGIPEEAFARKMNPDKFVSRCLIV